MSESTDLDPHVASQLEGVVDGLVAHTNGSVHRHVLRELVFDNYQALAADAKVTTFLPVLAGNMALAQIEQSGGAQQAEGDPVLPALLVLDEHNSTRSQAAAALFRFYAPGRFRVASAGLRPNPVLNPGLTTALGEVGLELTDAPRQAEAEEIAAADYVIAIGADGIDWEDPAPNTTRWPIPDPNPDDTASVRAALAAVDASVRAFLRTVDPDHELHPPVLAEDE
jgi:protein-tyrosine-phosphatase